MQFSEERGCIHGCPEAVAAVYATSGRVAIALLRASLHRQAQREADRQAPALPAPHRNRVAKRFGSGFVRSARLPVPCQCGCGSKRANEARQQRTHIRILDDAAGSLPATQNIRASGRDACARFCAYGEKRVRRQFSERARCRSAGSDRSAKLAVEAGVDSIEHGSFLSEATLKLMKQKGVYLVPTRLASYWIERQMATYPPVIAEKARAAAAAHTAMMKAALKIGVPIALGTDSGVSPHGMNGKEFSLLVELGMPAAAALISGTREAAKLLGVDATVGTLESGKLADIVAVRGNVLNDISVTEKPVFVMKRGTVVVEKK
ncbi:MAG: amidohydrolase family protein, partial [Steroidobacteraceae bacterium]